MTMQFLLTLLRKMPFEAVRSYKVGRTYTVVYRSQTDSRSLENSFEFDESGFLVRPSLDKIS